MGEPRLQKNMVKLFGVGVRFKKCIQVLRIGNVAKGRKYLMAQIWSPQRECQKPFQARVHYIYDANYVRLLWALHLESLYTHDNIYLHGSQHHLKHKEWPNHILATYATINVNDKPAGRRSCEYIYIYIHVHGSYTRVSIRPEYQPFPPSYWPYHPSY